jgi:hypothetical protein
VVAQATWIGPVIAAAMFLANVFNSFFSNLYFRIMMNIGLNMRGMIITALYRKSLRLSPAARANMVPHALSHLISFAHSFLPHCIQFLLQSQLVSTVITLFCGIVSWVPVDRPDRQHDEHRLGASRHAVPVHPHDLDQLGAGHRHHRAADQLDRRVGARRLGGHHCADARVCPHEQYFL